MKYLKFIYNPYSGDRTIGDYLDKCVTIFQNASYEVHILRSTFSVDIEENISSMPKNFYDTVVICGGDGTINIVINALLKNNIDVKIGIIPSGTANDFARYINIPKEIEKAAQTIVDGHFISADVGLANDKYFINVCSAGLLTTVSQTVDKNAKNSFGMLAYYIKGIGEIPNFVPLSVKFTNSSESFIEDIYFFIVLNSAGTGGFDKLSPTASISDGVFDFIAFKAMPLIDVAKVFIKILSGKYLYDPNIIYFQDSYIKIEPLFENEKYLTTDIDGEQGPTMPIEIKNLHNKLKIFIPIDLTIVEN